MRPLFSRDSSRVDWVICGVALLLATLLRGLLEPWLHGYAPFITFYPAVIVAAWFGGFRPALLTTVGSLLASWWLFVPPKNSFLIHDNAHLFGLGAFLLCGIGVSLLGDSMRRNLHLVKAAEKTCREQMELIEVTIRSIGDGVIASDSMGRVHLMNRIACNLTGWEPSEAQGRPIEDIFVIVDEKHRRPVENPVRRAVAERRVVPLANHTLLIDKNGTARPIDDTAAPIQGEGGEINGAILVFRDVTKKREAERTLERSEQQLNAFFENAVIGIHWVSPDGVILRANQADMDLVGYPREEYIGRHIADFHVNRDLVQEMLARLARGETLRDFSAQLQAKDGSIRDVLVDSSVLWEDGQFVHTCCFTRDVTLIRMADITNSRLAAIVESSNDAIISKDLRGIVSSWNPAAENLLGYRADEMIGQSIHAIIPKERWPEEDRILSLLRAGKKIERLETMRRHKDGKLIPVSLSISPIFDQSGCIVGASKIIRDDSELKRGEAALRESEASFRTLGEAVPDFLWMSSADGTPIYQNPAWMKYTGLTSESLTNDFWETICHPSDWPGVMSKRSMASEAKRPFEVEFRCRRHDGEYRWFLSRTVPVMDENGAVIKWVGTMTDIHARHLAEDALTEADRRKDAFLATLAHELRNPLAPLANALQLLRLKQCEGVELEQVLSIMERQSKQLVRLVDDLLDVSRVNQGKLTLKRELVRLKDVIGQAIEINRPSIEAKKHRLLVTFEKDDPIVDADPLRITQVISNLLNNASKYTDEEGEIALAVKQEQDEVSITIRDSGIGIPPDQLTSVFDMFMQVDRTLTRVQGGLGIGLTLVKDYIQMHGGRVEAHSDGPNLGSTFVVWLPLSTSKLPEPPTDTKEVPPLKRHRILIVDDTRTTSFILAKLLEAMGQETYTESDSLRVVNRARELRPDLIFSDIAMPGMDGYELAKCVRSEKELGPLTLVALTGYGQEADRQRALQAGFHFHLVKPVSQDTLEQLLRTISQAPSHE